MTLVNDADYFYSILKSYGRNNEHIRFARGLNEMQEAIDALRETIARLEREKGLLVAVAEAAREMKQIEELAMAIHLLSLCPLIVKPSMTVR